jgi:hypothetical protein
MGGALGTQGTEMNTGFSLEHLKEKDHLEDLDIYLRIKVQRDLKET